jgi:hypothetical protein
MPNPKATYKQHFVPRLLLRRFADTHERLWAYDKLNDAIFRTNVEDAAQKHNWLSLPGTDPADAPGATAEQFFGQYEDDAAEAIDDILWEMARIRYLIDRDRRFNGEVWRFNR